MRLTKRQRIALCSVSPLHGSPMPRALFSQLERKGLVRRGLYDYEVEEFGRVVRRLPVAILLPAGEALRHNLGCGSP